MATKKYQTAQHKVNTGLPNRNKLDVSGILNKDYQRMLKEQARNGNGNMQARNSYGNVPRSYNSLDIGAGLNPSGQPTIALNSDVLFSNEKE